MRETFTIPFCHFNEMSTCKMKGRRYVQEPDDLGSGLASSKSNDVTADTLIQLSPLILVSLDE